MSTLRVAVLMGGASKEREISLRTGNEVYEALLKKGFFAVKIDVDKNIAENLKKTRARVAFIALHGRLGEDGTVQGMLEILGIPYTGSGVLASALAINKIYSKKIWQKEGINTPPFIVLTKEGLERGAYPRKKKELKSIGPPFVIKPAMEGSTIGLGIAESLDQLGPALEEALKFDQEVVIEQFVKGKEITVGILGNKDPEPLPTLEVVTRRDLYDYEAKYTPGLSEHIIPARLPESQRKAAQRLSLWAHQALGCRGFSRVDLIVTEDGTPFVLELNTIPGLTQLSLFPDAARAAGLDFPSLVSKLVYLALEE